MERATVACQIKGGIIFQVDWNLREVLLKPVAVTKLSMDLKIWMMNSAASAGKELVDLAELSTAWWDNEPADMLT